MADETTRPGYRGKCLYKTGKCNNERALKTSGQAHNLCDEHRHRQNEHQRKLDAKNRFARKDKRAKGDSPTSASSTARGHAQRYAPYGKVRMSPNGATTAPTVDDVHALLGRNGIVATPAMSQSMMQFHALGVEGANAMAAASQMVGGANGTPVAPGAPEILPSGVVILPNGPQAPQMPYPSPMQDFDGIVVPLPSYLEGHERVEFRSRIYQKVLDFIAEECMRRFGAVNPTTAGAAPQLQPLVGSPSDSTERREEVSNSTDGAVPALEDPKTQGSATESEESSNENKTVPSETINDKEGNDDEQPEDADEDGGDDEEDTPRSKRATRSRGNTRKDSQIV